MSGLQAAVLTLFPRMIDGYVSESILGKAAAKGLLSVKSVDIRDFSVDKHHTTDDVPYGGGAGMVMKVEPLVAAITSTRVALPNAPVILLSPRGPTFTQAKARSLRDQGSVILVCGRYEGIDERAMRAIDEELSMGDFILTGGELGALAVIDAVARLIPGVLGNSESAITESFESGLLEHPHYTRPAVWNGVAVPEVLQSGNHARIDRWRRWHALKLTQARRPDLFAALQLSQADRRLLDLSEDQL